MSELVHKPSDPSNDDSTATADEDLLAELADDLAARLRLGQQPKVEEYVDRHPALAERIKKVFQAVTLMEQTRSIDFAAGGERPGETIGRYKLLERIGEGGFGVVYMAEQLTPVRRRVALKVVKPGMDSRQVLARFEAERQALAIMDHPNIAKVFDAGTTESGRPYFVMELVKGEPITEFCDRNQLPPRERLELFGQVCHAVQHAHQKGIIHRDIKPTNVLVMMHDTSPVVKVIDFGVAKALGQELTEKTLFTGFAQLIGTPLYMSPEQAGQSSIDVDTRSDIYSLGVLLYELLTGTTPFTKERFRKAANDEICRIIREEEPPKPSTRLSDSKESLPSISAQRHMEPAKLTKLVRGELDWIVMKALEKDRSRRYETANGLASDVQRYLNDEAVLACPPSKSYRVRKLFRKHRVSLMVLAGFIAMLTVASVVSTWQAVRATRAERAAIAERDAKDAARRDAVTQAQQSEQMLTFLVEAFRSPDPSRGGRTITVAEVLDQAENDLDTKLVDQAQSRANLLRAIGHSRHALGLYEDAIRSEKAAVDLYEKEFGKNHPDTLMAMHYLARSYISAGRRPEGVALYKEVLDVRQKTLGPADPATLKSMRSLASMYSGDEAIRLHEQVVAALQDQLGPTHRETLAAKVQLGSAYLRKDRFDDGIALYQQIRKQSEDTLGRDHPFTLVATNGLGYAYYRAGRLDEAIPLIEETLAARRAKLGPRHADTLTTLGNLASAYEKAGRVAEAVPLYEETIAARRESLGPGHIETILSSQKLAPLYGRLGQRDKAIALYEEALAAFGGEKNKARWLSEYQMLGALANAYYDAGRVSDAVATLEKAGRAAARTSPQGLREIAWTFAASPRPGLRNAPLGVEFASKAVELVPKDGVMRKTLGVAHYRAGEHMAAIQALMKSMELREGGDAADWIFLAMAEWQLGNKDEAHEWYDKAVEWMEKNAPADKELIRFRAEAAELLGVKEKKPPDS